MIRALHEVNDYKLVDAAYFISDIVIPNDKGEPLKYFGVVHDALLKKVIPAVNEFRAVTRGNHDADFATTLEEVQYSTHDRNRQCTYRNLHVLGAL